MFNFSPLSYPYINTAVFLQKTICSRGNYLPPVFTWFAFGKRGENLFVTPSSSTQYVTATGPNKFLNSVTVKPTSTTTTEAGA